MDIAPRPWLVDAGLNVRVLRLPLDAREQKADLDAFLLAHPAHQLQHLLDIAPSLVEYQRSLPRSLLKAVDLLPQSSYPLRRSRPQRLEGVAPSPVGLQHAQSLDEVRSSVRRWYAITHSVAKAFYYWPIRLERGKGITRLRGFRGGWRRRWIQAGSCGPACARQIHDQAGITLTPLHGRNHTNCEAR